MTEGATTGRCWPGVVRSQYRGQRGASGPDHPSEAVSRRLGKRLVVNVGDKSIAASLMPVQPGPETEALRRFLVDCTWAGDVEAGGMGPGSPAMTAIGRATVEWISDGIWAVSDLEQQQFVGGKEVLTWKAHLIAGWDFSAREYRASVADSNGNWFIRRPDRGRPPNPHVDERVHDLGSAHPAALYLGRPRARFDEVAERNIGQGRPLDVGRRVHDDTNKSPARRTENPAFSRRVGQTVGPRATKAPLVVELDVAIPRRFIHLSCDIARLQRAAVSCWWRCTSSAAGSIIADLPTRRQELPGHVARRDRCSLVSDP